VHIKSAESGKVLDVGLPASPLAAIVQRDSSGQASQSWCVEKLDDGYFGFRNEGTGNYLNVLSSSQDDGASIVEYRWEGTDNERWSIASLAGGHVVIKAKHSGKALDLERHLKVDGAPVKQYQPHGGPNQQWILEPS
jgi:hypothetical protein